MTAEQLIASAPFTADSLMEAAAMADGPTSMRLAQAAQTIRALLNKLEPQLEVEKFGEQVKENMQKKFDGHSKLR